jgi:hypothetical protein
MINFSCQTIDEWSKQYTGDLFHALIADTPYEIGFMNNQWDKSGVAFQIDTWKCMLPFLHPGAFGLAYASTRGYHRLACAIEDAGYIIHPSIFVWARGQGMPKATRIDVQIDRSAGVTPDTTPAQGMGKQNPNWNGTNKGRKQNSLKPTYNKKIAVTPLAQEWQNHRYGRQLLKPSVEPIIVFQKPYEGKPVDSITRTGAGAINIESGRISVTEQDTKNVNRKINRNKRKSNDGWGLNDHEAQVVDVINSSGRWPSNFALVHNFDCERIGIKKGKGYALNRHTDGANPWGNARGKAFESAQIDEEIEIWNCSDGCPIKTFNEENGVLTSGANAIRTKPSDDYHGNMGQAGDVQISYGDSGGAARFFKNSHWSYEVEEQLYFADQAKYQAKPPLSEREAGLESRKSVKSDFGTAEWMYGEHRETSRKNTHPTVKPIDLNKWLAALLLPPDKYAPRRILNPFSGSGSESIGAMLAGWEEVVGIEQSAEYIEIANARSEFWSRKFF